MKFSFRLLASILLLSILGGCGDSSTSPSSNVSPVAMTIPSGWTRQDNTTSSGSQQQYTLTSPTGTGIVMALTTPRSSMSADQVIQLELAAYQSQYVGMVVDSNLTRSVAGYQARILEFHMIESGTTVTEREVVFQTAANDVQVLFTRLTSDTATAATMLGMESQIRIQ